MLWPMQALFRFVTGPDVIRSIVGWAPKNASGSGTSIGLTARFLVLAGEQDVLCTPTILKDAAERYGAAVRQCAKMGRLNGISESDIKSEDVDEGSGVAFKVAKGLGHHLQNHVKWERSAEHILKWVEQL